MRLRFYRSSFNFLHLASCA